MTEKIRWGIIGTGNIASSFANDFKFSKGGELHAVASRSEQTAVEFADKFGIHKRYASYSELFTDPDIDVVYIATPHTLHFENTREALRSGKAVLCEKPLSTNPELCGKLIDLARSENQYLLEAIWTFFLPPVRKALDWIREGSIGSIRHIKADFAFKATYDPANRLFNPDLAGGALLDIGIYPISLAWMVMKKMPQKITVDAQMAPTGVDVQEFIYFEYEEGTTASLFASFDFDLPNEAVIAGTDGYIRIPEFFKARECFLYRHGKLLAHFEDNRISAGYNFEIDAVNEDLMSNLKESQLLGHRDSMNIQEIISAVRFLSQQRNKQD